MTNEEREQRANRIFYGPPFCPLLPPWGFRSKREIADYEKAQYLYECWLAFGATQPRNLA